MIRTLQEQAIRWPDEAEREEIARRIQNKYQIPNCVAVANGTLLSLMNEPQTVDAPDYHGCKFPYSLSIMIVNDDRRFIRYYLSGFPGCTHNNQVYQATKLAKDPEAYFGDKYFLVADSARRTNSICLVAMSQRGNKTP